MDKLFIDKVRAAAVAGWWTILIAYCILIIQWLAYVLIMAKHPAATPCLWGEGVLHGRKLEPSGCGQWSYINYA